MNFLLYLMEAIFVFLGFNNAFLQVLLFIFSLIIGFGSISR